MAMQQVPRNTIQAMKQFYIMNDTDFEGYVKSLDTYMLRYKRELFNIALGLMPKTPILNASKSTSNKLTGDSDLNAYLRDIATSFIYQIEVKTSAFVKRLQKIQKITFLVANSDRIDKVCVSLLGSSGKPEDELTTTKMFEEMKSKPLRTFQEYYNDLCKSQGLKLQMKAYTINKSKKLQRNVAKNMNMSRNTNQNKDVLSQLRTTNVNLYNGNVQGLNDNDEDLILVKSWKFMYYKLQLLDELMAQFETFLNEMRYKIANAYLSQKMFYSYSGKMTKTITQIQYNGNKVFVILRTDPMNTPQLQKNSIPQLKNDTLEVFDALTKQLEPTNKDILNYLLEKIHFVNSNGKVLNIDLNFTKNNVGNVKQNESSWSDVANVYTLGIDSKDNDVPIKAINNDYDLTMKLFSALESEDEVKLNDVVQQINASSSEKAYTGGGFFGLSFTKKTAEATTVSQEEIENLKEQSKGFTYYMKEAWRSAIRACDIMNHKENMILKKEIIKDGLEDIASGKIDDEVSNRYNAIQSELDSSVCGKFSELRTQMYHVRKISRYFVFGLRSIYEVVKMVHGKIQDYQYDDNEQQKKRVKELNMIQKTGNEEDLWKALDASRHAYTARGQAEDTINNNIKVNLDLNNDDFNNSFFNNKGFNNGMYMGGVMSSPRSVFKTSKIIHKIHMNNTTKYIKLRSVHVPLRELKGLYVYQDETHIISKKTLREKSNMLVSRKR